MAAVIARAAALTVLVLASPALAQVTPSVRIEAAREAYADLEYERAVELLEAALATSSIRTLERAQALETLAFALVVLDREAEARDRLRELFELDPYYDVREPTRSPRIEAVVDRVRHQIASDAALVAGLDVRLELPRSARTDRPVRVRVRVGGEGHDRVAAVVIRHRAETEVDWASVDATRDPGDTFSTELPARGPGGEADGRIELYAEARDARGNLLGRSGGPLSPALLEVSVGGSEGSGENLLEAWWLWTIVGVVAVGAAVGIGVGVSASQPGTPSGTLPPGRVVLP